MSGTATALASPGDLAPLMGVPFSRQQLAAITAPLEPGLVVAGAGTGKTTVMAARVVWLVGTGRVRPDAVLGLTFTTKAAGELGTRVRAALERAGLLSRVDDRPLVDEEDAADEPTVLTYHAYAGRLLSEHGLRIGLEPDTRLLGDATRFQLAARAVRRYRGRIDRLSTWVPSQVVALLALDAELSEHLVTPADVRELQRRELPAWAATRQTAAVRGVVDTFAARDELLRLVEEYRAVKSERAVMDFSDQMASAARLAEEHAAVGAAQRTAFRVVLLDEYQDTSVAQVRLLRALFAGGSAGHPVTAVGDPCQAIYGWRGASASNLERFPREFPRPDGSPARRFPLTVNRRSCERVLVAANRVAAPLHAAFEGALPLEPSQGTGAGSVLAAVCETAADELAFVAEHVARRHADGVVWREIAVLARDNAGVADLHDALVRREIPVEVVGLAGLLRAPEVVEVVSTLEVIGDLTANAALLGLLSGPRWAVGTRDLALLGRRARLLARDAAPEGDAGAGQRDVRANLDAAVAGTDPAEIVALAEALDDPGPLPFSTEARARFRELSRELKDLRRHAGEPLLDLVRRVIETIGLDIELAASTSPVLARRRDNLATFVDAVAAFAGSDADASLPALLAFLAAEEEYGQGMGVAAPTPRDAVSLLTVHRAKGLEWDVVLVPQMATGVFPTPRGSARWTTTAAALPDALRGDAADRPAVAQRSQAGLAAYVEASRERTLSEERRLAYVAVTRPRRELVVSTHWWGPRQLRPRGPSPFFDDVRAVLAGIERQPEPDVAAPADGAVNPADDRQRPVPWPGRPDADELRRRTDAAALVHQAQTRDWRQAVAEADADLLLDDLAVVREWDRDLDWLLDEARRDEATQVVVELPSAVSATLALRVADDPAAVARDLARPMPRRPSPEARFGTRFHAWVEQELGRPLLLDEDDLPGRADLGIADDDDLRAVIEAFRAGPFAERAPLRVEAPFSLALGGRVVRGRIDAVYRTDEGYEVVDWKTNRAATADPLQLAIYRLAWAELAGVPLHEVGAAFYYVRTGEVVRFDSLPGREALERTLLSGS